MLPPRSPARRPYRRFPVASVAGLLPFLIGGPLAGLFFHPLVHRVHAGASPFVVLGLWGPIRREPHAAARADVLPSSSSTGAVR